MSKASRYYQNIWLDWFSATDVPTPPTEVYLGLFSSDPTDLNTGTEVSTVVSGGTRVPITFGTPIVSGTDGLSMSNDDVVIYANSSSGNANLTHAAIFDAASGGNMLVYFQFDQSVQVFTGDPVVFGQGRINIISRLAFSEYMINLKLEWIRGTVPPTAPSQLYLAPYNTNPGFNNTGTEITNLVFPTSDRPEIDMGDLVNEVLFSRISNIIAYNFGNTLNNVTIAHLGWFDAATAGNLLAYVPLNTVVELFTGEPFIIGRNKVQFGIA